MKKTVLLLLLPLLLLLGACGRAEAYTVEHDGLTYLIDLREHTICTGELVCKFKLTNKTGEGYRLTICYPDGSLWYYYDIGFIVTDGYTSEEGFTTTSGHTDDYDPSKYLPAETLKAALDASPAAALQRSTGHPAFLLLALLGILHAAFPQFFWYINHGWRYKNAEPSDAALGVTRIVGVLAALLASGCFFLGST